jgi:hypothetical protein
MCSITDISTDVNIELEAHRHDCHSYVRACPFCIVMRVKGNQLKTSSDYRLQLTK